MNKLAKPFVKWAGGKNQLISQIKKIIPDVVKKEPFTYIEPFVGGGAVFFWITQNFPNIKKAVINDINQDLINSHITIKDNVLELIKVLKNIEKEYHSFGNNLQKQKEYYYSIRELFNSRKSEKTIQAALFIFLNRTCFNGLYRVNKNNEFNVPIGRYKRPTICDEENLINVSNVLQNTIILNGDFEKTLNYAEGLTLFYMDPPYKPLNRTSNFNSYSQFGFDDNEQIRLLNFCKKLDNLGYYWILSNSDVKDEKTGKSYFENLYYEYFIKRVFAKRHINSKADKRGELSELLIMNYRVKRSNSYEQTISIT